MSESKEYATLVSCTDRLELALTEDRDILHFLEKERYNLSDDVGNPNSRLSPHDKAVLVVDAIKKKTKLNSQNYHKLIVHFHTNEIKYRDIINILDKEYHKIVLSHNDLQLSPGADPSESTIVGILKSNIRDSFTDLTVKVMRKLKSRNIDVDDFRLYLISRFGCGDFISSISSVPEMIEAVTRKPLWNYYNYHVLEGIIKHFGKDDSELIGWIDEYKTKLTAFKATTKIADYIEDCTDDELMADTDEDYKKQYDKRFYCRLALKLRESKDRINEKCLSFIDTLWKSISDHFLLPPLHILLEKIRKGSIEVTLIVPITTALIIDLKATSQRSTEFYRQKNIVCVTMDDKVLYDEDEEVIPKNIVTEDVTEIIPSQVDCSSLELGLMFEPPDMSKKTGTFYIRVERAKLHLGYSNSFVKVCLLPKKKYSRRRRTSAIRNNLNPIWNEEFTYKNVTLDELSNSERELEVTVWEHHSISKNNMRQSLHLGLTSGGTKGSHWEEMLSRQGEWVKYWHDLHSGSVECISVETFVHPRPRRLSFSPEFAPTEHKTHNQVMALSLNITVAS